MAYIKPTIKRDNCIHKIKKDGIISCCKLHGYCDLINTCNDYKKETPQIKKLTDF